MACVVLIELAGSWRETATAGAGWVLARPVPAGVAMELRWDCDGRGWVGADSARGNDGAGWELADPAAMELR